MYLSRMYVDNKYAPRSDTRTRRRQAQSRRQEAEGQRAAWTLSHSAAATTGRNEPEAKDEVRQENGLKLLGVSLKVS